MSAGSITTSILSVIFSAKVHTMKMADLLQGQQSLGVPSAAVKPSGAWEVAGCPRPLLCDNDIVKMPAHPHRRVPDRNRADASKIWKLQLKVLHLHRAVGSDDAASDQIHTVCEEERALMIGRWSCALAL